LIVLEYFTAPGSIPFTSALLVMLGLLVFEIIALVNGLGLNDLVDDFIVSNVDMPDDLFDVGSDLSMDAPDDLSTGIEGSGAPEGGSVIGRVLAWLYIGRVPVLMVLIVFLTVFSIFGLMAQSILRESVGFALPGVIAAPAVFFLSLPLVRWCTGGLARVLPKDETSAISTRTFIGRTAIVVGGTARHGLPAQARLTDQFGTIHYVLVEPEENNEILENGSLVLLVRRINGRFSAIANPNAALAENEG
jgi:hypothetical protein